MDQYDNESNDERLVRTALLAAYPPTRSEFSMRRGEQIVRAAAAERQAKRSLLTSRVAACVAASFTLLAGTAGAAGAALPGQPLYPLKRMVERAMVAVAADDTEAARLELQFAERRLDEATATTEAPVASELAREFNEHVNAANALAGDAVADEIDRLDPAVDDSSDTTYDRSSAGGDASAPVVSTQPQPSVSASPSPSPSPSPSASPSASPSPSPSPSSSPSPSANPSAGPQPSVAPQIPPQLPRSPVVPPAGLDDLPSELAPAEIISRVPQP